MRPVATWKSTEAAPTSVSAGPYWVPPWVSTPSPFWPWQKAHPTRKSSRPFWMSSVVVACSSAWAPGEKSE